jgi:choline dehydrogenase-like flavoprotein
METLIPIGPALADVLSTTNLGALRGPSANDAIVVGAGASGGLAALLLAEAGLRVLVLDAGAPRSRMRAPMRRMAGALARRLADPASLSLLPPVLIPKGRAMLRLLGRWRQPVQSRCYAWERSPDAFVDDHDCPYLTPSDRPFFWFRARLLGGRVAIPGHGRQYYRLGESDFQPADGLTPPWPLQAGELDPWYALVERRIGLSGCRDGLAWLPDSELVNVLEPTAAEAAMKAAIEARWRGTRPVLGRYAPPLNTLEAAALTGRLRCRQGAIVREIMVDNSGSVRGVVWFDQRDRTEERALAPLVFLCASALESTRILLLSRSAQNPEGLGAASGALGRFLMDHVLLSAEGVGPRLPAGPMPEEGQCIYLSRFDVRESSTICAGRGFGVQLYRSPGIANTSHFIAVSQGEMLPRSENRVTLDATRRDAWGIPILRIECSRSGAELARAADQNRALRELAEVASVKLLRIDEAPAPPGSAVHECGTARMGGDPATSVLDPDNQCWDARGLYVTDAASFPSQGTQNPTLTILALTARACSHATNMLPSRCSTASREAGSAGSR